MGKKDSRRKRKLTRERERLRRKAQGEDWARIQAEAADRLAQSLELPPVDPDERFRTGLLLDAAREAQEPRLTAIEQELFTRLERQEEQIRSLRESNERLRQAIAQIRAGHGAQVRFSPGLQQQIEEAQERAKDELLDLEVEIVDD